MVAVGAQQQVQRRLRLIDDLLRGKLGAVDDRAGEGRRHVVQVPLGDHGAQALAAHVDLHGLVVQNVAVDIAQADRALDDVVGELGLQALVFTAVVGDHRAAGDPADLLALIVYGHARTHDAAVEQRDGADAARQRRHVGKVAVHDALIGVGLLLQRLAADEIALERGEAHREAGDRHGKDGDGLALGVEPELVSVEGKARLHAQRVARAETGGAGAQLDQAVPQPHAVLVFDIDLVAERLAGVAGLGHADPVTLQLESVEGVAHRLGDGLAAGQLRQQLLALRTLHGDGRPVGGDVRQRAVVVLRHGAQMGPVLVGVARVHDQQETLLLEAVEVGVVDGKAAFIGNHAVLGAVEIQGADVAGQHVLQKLDPLRSLDQDASHVGHVEQGAEVAGVEVFGHDAAGILHGHLPAAELHHRRAGRDVRVIKLSAFPFAHRIPPKIVCPKTEKGRKTPVCFSASVQT